MAIVIVVEDGTNVPDANSYATVQEARDFASLRGVTLAPDGSDGDDTVAVMLIKAMDYLESKSCEYAGEKTNGSQSLEWPRANAYILGFTECSDTGAYPDDSIPNILKKAQCQAVIAISQGYDLMPNITASDFVTEETVGPITTKYANPIGLVAEYSAVEALLKGLFGTCGGMSLFTRRV